MHSKFEFLEEQFPKLAHYGVKAEECINTDPDICLLSLGMMAGAVTKILCRKNHIPEDNNTEALADVLLSRQAINEGIHRKIIALAEMNDDTEGCASEIMCGRLMSEAEELCRWLMFEGSEGKFSFLGELFPPDKPVPILMNFSELGREAEENLYSNTRYCLICLGDIGEAAADRLIMDNSIETHEKDQIDRIDILYDNHIITEEIKNILHDLRIARNKAIHERYNDRYTSQEEGKRLLNDAIYLCEWVFMRTAKPGYVVKARIKGSEDGGYSAAVGSIPAYLSSGEIPEGKECTEGKKYVFKILDIEDGKIILSMTDADNDYNLSQGRLYAKYKLGQNVHVTIKSLSNSTGAIVELKDGLEARIPKSELGRHMYKYDDDNNKLVRYETTARVKWFSLTEYPPMLLSVKDIEDEEAAGVESEVEFQAETEKIPQEKPAMSDLDFRTFCQSATYEEIIQALDEGANPNAKNGKNTTALMTASERNKNARVIKALIDAGADINARNHKGNTALMYAAMENGPEAVQVLCEAGADIEAANKDGKKAADYAAMNRRLSGTEIMRLLRPEPEVVPEVPEAPNAQEPELPPMPEPEPETIPEPEHEPETPPEVPEIPQAQEPELPEVPEIEPETIPELENEVIPEVPEVPQAQEPELPAMPEPEPETIPEPEHEVIPEVPETPQAQEPELPEMPEPEPETISELEYEMPPEIPEATQEEEPEYPENEYDIQDEDEDEYDEDEPLPDFSELHRLIDEKTEIAGLEEPQEAAQEELAEAPEIQPETQELSGKEEEPMNFTEEENNEYEYEEPSYYEIEAPGTENGDYDSEDHQLTQEQEEEARNVLRVMLEKDFLKICRSGTEDEILEALNAGVDVNVMNKSASTALMFAARGNTAQSVEILIHAGANINAKDNNGNTALIYAASYNTDDVVDILIDAGADKDIENSGGHKAADYAKMNYRLEDTEAVKKL